VEALEAVQHGYLERSDPLEKDRWRARPAARKLIENIARQVSPLL
jgi:hypothetical protein